MKGCTNKDSNGNQDAKFNADASGQWQGQSPGRGPCPDTGQATAFTNPSTAGPDIVKPEVVAAAQHVTSPEAEALYAGYMAEIYKRELSGIEHFDKSVLTLSSAGLGLSVTFLKDVIQLDRAVFLLGLYFSWMMFVAAIVCTLLSFLVSSKALEHQKGIAERAYRQGDDGAFTEPNRFDTLTRGLNYTSAGTFVGALLLTTAFVIVNMEMNRMATNHQPAPILEKKGATVPTMQRPAAPAPAPAPAPASPPAGSK